MTTLAPVDYVRPYDLHSAVAALREPGSVALAGGHHLLTLLKRREATAARLVDLTNVEELHGIGVETDGRVRVGASTTLTALLTAPELRAADGAGDGAAEPFGALVDAVSLLGDRQSRNRVTVGGQLACGRVGNDLAAALLVLDTEVTLCGPQGVRTASLADLWPDPATARPALRPAELIVEVRCLPAACGSGYARMTDRANLEAVCGIAVAAPDPASAEDARRGWRVGATGLERRPTRVPALEQALDQALGSASAGRGPIRLAPVPPSPDVLDNRQAGEQYRRYMAGVLAGRAAARALGRASAVALAS